MYENLFTNISIGLFMILTTFMFHAFSLDRLIRVVQRILPQTRKTGNETKRLWKMSVLLLTSLGIICIHSIEIWLWAFLYLYLDISAVKDLETAVYFSTTSFSTVGYGDIVLSPDDRLLGAMQATSGMLLFGWSTAFIFEVLSVTYERFNIRKLTID